MIYGYSDNPVEKLNNVEKFYFDHVTSFHKSRPQLKKLLSKIQNGDMLIVKSISCFSFSIKMCISVLNKLLNKNVVILSDDFPNNNNDIKTFVESLYNIPKRKVILPRPPQLYTRKKVNIDENIWNTYYILWKQNAISKLEWSRKMKISPATFNRRFEERYPDEIKKSGKKPDSLNRQQI